MKTDKKGKELIKSFEGLRLEAYKCPAGVWTIGYGHTSGVKPGQLITEQEANILLESDLVKVDAAINELVTSKLTQERHNALADFIFNLGIGNFKGSTLLRKINAGANDEEIAAEFRRWIFSAGKKLPGLERRRATEADLWLKDN